MVEKVDIYKGAKIKFKGSLDLNRMYNKIMEWLEGEDFSVKEDFYKQRIKSSGQDIEISWTATQSKHPYINWESKIIIYIVGVNDNEVERDGKKIKLSNCTIEVRFDAWQITNPKDEYKGIIKSFYEKFIIGEKVEENKILLFKTMQELVSEFKSFIALYQT
ncbi:hypothetical protein J4459_00895 [Candidatus Woesearchaeota archaeon]|nr:hypothetical protein [Candidatus Woesearchaeota archaeon]